MRLFMQKTFRPATQAHIGPASSSASCLATRLAARAITRVQIAGAAGQGHSHLQCEVSRQHNQPQSGRHRSLSCSAAQTQTAVRMATAPTVFPALSVFVNDAQVAIQPKGPHASRQVQTLSINLDTGKIQVLQADAQFGSPLDVLAVLGVCKLHAGNALVVVTAARKVAQIGGADIFEVVGSKVVASDAARSNKNNKGLLRLLEEAVDHQGAGRGLYFSYFYDVTQTTQRTAGLSLGDPEGWASQLPVQRAAGKFFWNKALAAPLLSAGAQQFVQPCMLGFVQQLPGLQLREPNTGKNVVATLTLVSRRAVQRAGTRQWRRGADTSGNVANFAETEQMVTIDGPSGHPLAGVTASYVLCRGSIPLLWTQLPNIKYKPTTVIAPSDVSGPVHDKHFTQLVDQYESVVAINLINQGHGTGYFAHEGKLEAAFRCEATRLVESNSPAGQRMRYVAFDFHRECSNKRYHRLSLLWDELVQDFEDQAFCMVGPNTGKVKTQSGIMRVNCIDCLDRTNVVQGVLARKSFEAVLVSLGLLGKGVSLPEAYPDIERQFKIIWADHGDQLSTQYAGTGAMKSGFTRTGKRTIGGAIDDGVKAVVRYYLNNYQDGVKQDAIDLITGAYTCDTINVPPIRPQPSPIIPMVLSLLAIGIAAHNMMAVLGFLMTGNPVAPLPEAEATATAATGLLGTARRLAHTVYYSPPVTPTLPATGSITMSTTAAPITDAIAAHGGFPQFAGSVVYYVVVPLVLGAGLLTLMVQNGKYLVNRPQLCPQLAVTVQKPVKESKKAA